MKAEDLIITPPWPPGTQVMLAEGVTRELALQVGSESVLTIQFHTGGHFEGNRFLRCYWVQHCGRGRRCFQLEEADLRRLTPEEARGQELLYREQLREGVVILKEFAEMLDEEPLP